MAQPAFKDDTLATPHHDEDHDQHDALGPDEPRTPAWLTATGGALFLLAVVWFIASRPASPTLDEVGTPSADVAQQQE